MAHPDPTAELCRVRDSLLERDPTFLENKLPPPYRGEISTIAPSPNLEYADESYIPAVVPEYVNKGNYEALQGAKSSYARYNAKPTEPQGGLVARDVRSSAGSGTTPFEEAVRNTNPVEGLGTGLFIDRAGIKLANIDALYRVSDRVATFADIAGGPGAWSQYMQWRTPEAKGFGITLRRDPRLDWNFRALNAEIFTPLYGENEASAGDLFVEWSFFVNRVLEDETNGVRLTLADGGAEVPDLARQEFFLSPLILVQALTCLSVGAIGSTLVLKIFDTVTEFSAQLLYLLSLCYEELNIFKPLSSRPANSERYLIGRGRREPAHVQPVIELFKECLQGLHPTQRFPISLLQGSLPEPFVQWLSENNNTSVRVQIEAARAILRYLRSPLTPEQVQDLRDQYDFSRISLVWDLPTEPLPSTIRALPQKRGQKGQRENRQKSRQSRAAYSLSSTLPLTSSQDPRAPRGMTQESYREQRGQREQRARGRGRGGEYSSQRRPRGSGRGARTERGRGYQGQRGRTQATFLPITRTTPSTYSSQYRQG